MKNVLLCLLFPLFSFSQTKSLGEKILGEKTLPSIILNDGNGKKVDVADYSKNGQVTVVAFWATWCVPCKKELNNISEHYDDWKEKYNVKLVAASIDDSRSSGKVKSFADSQRWQFDLLLDVNQDLKRDLNIQTVPFTVLLNKQGKIVYTHSGYVEGDELILEDEIKKYAEKE